MWRRIAAEAANHPDDVALRRCDHSGTVRYGQLDSQTGRIAADFAAASIGRRDRVLIVSDNGPQTYLGVLACARTGVIAVMADGALPPATIARFAEITTPSAVAIAPGARLRAADLPDSLRGLPLIDIGIGSGPADSARVAGSEDLPDSAADDPLAMIFTSGTTGEPKAVLLPNRTFYAIADILAAERLSWVDWEPGETTYSPLPATHIGGLWWILNCLMHGSVCVTGGEDTTSLLEILERHQVATACLVPTLITRLVAEQKATGADLPQSLRLLGYGGSRAVASDIDQVETAGVRTAQVYGLSETGCTALCLPTGDGSIDRIAASAVGRPYPGVQTRLDSAGTLWVNSPANMLGYWDNPEKTAEVLVDGWVNTGDLLEQHDDGYFYIRGRASEMIISGGVNVAPDEVDRIAERVPGVRQAACFEIPDPEFGALIGLAVVPTAELDAKQIRRLKQAIAARFRQESEPMARPARICAVTEIPRTASGKVIRAELAAAADGAPTGG
ncbi:fatty acid--CoA ligase FadD10 [Mycolicibacterium brumae]|uniref:fatty acid--CoA ligase FadD10 n=1 Tax=Mycolicibacterium brumae TaxID=85968 RepID=UPI000FFAB17C|nr:hypothetical protein MBRU_14405 [Mycolicibacterium brumae DSM 44177]